MAITRDDVENRFGFHPATEDTKDKHTEIRTEFIEFTSLLLSIVPEGREQSLMVTALEEASMWANAGVARNLAPLKLGE